MGWNMPFRLLHLFCAMAAMAGVHSQDDATVPAPHNQPFEGEAVHNMMTAWEREGTNPILFSRWGWHFKEHPCYKNYSQNIYWNGIACSTMPYQLEDNHMVQYHMVVRLELDVDDYASTLLFGKFPLGILNLTKLEHISISHATKLSGPLPTGLFCSGFQLQVLQNITLFNCSFNGSVSSGFGSRCGGNNVLEYLDLSRNSFTEMRPIYENEYSNYDPFNDFTNLQYLNVSHNQIKGRFVIRADALEIVDISNNSITNITALARTSELCPSLKSIYAQNNSINKFPIEILESDTLENIILDSNNIIGELYLPNISCQHSRIKLISLLYNNITHFYPSNDTTSCFSESSIFLDPKVFLYGNPVCTYSSHKTKLLRYVCRINATSPIEVGEFAIVNKILQFIIPCVSSVIIAIFITGFFVIQKLKKKISLLHEIQSEFDKRDVKPNLYSFSELKIATQDFHISNELGRGGFGIVYKGILLDGSHVAVKKLTKLSIEQRIQDFLSEIIVVSNIKHCNLVQLKGCCIRENQRILVHEFVENKNLKDALWGDSRSNGHLDWPTRFNIILGIARGLAYLHEDVQPPIVHRDIKGENILLDKHWNPKITDFGLAILFPSFDDGKTHMSVSTIAGTKGYMAPEYLYFGQVSTKLDVFSFGVLLLEIVSGRKKIDMKLPCREQYLVEWAQELHSNDNLPNLKDKSLEEMTMVDKATFKQVVKVGWQCLHHIAARRPAMSEVMAMLIGNKNVDDCDLEDYHEGSSSSYSMGSSSFCFSTQNSSLHGFFHSKTNKHSSLQCIVKDDNSLHLDLESHKQSLQLCEVGLLSK